MRSLVRSLIVAVLVVPVLTMIHAGTAEAASVQAFFNSSSGSCLADDGSFNGVVYDTVCRDDFPDSLPDFDKWVMSGYGDGSYRLQNVATGRCLDESIHYGLRANPTCQPPGPNAKYQAWRFSGMGGDGEEYRLQVMSTKTCLAESHYEHWRPTLGKCVLHNDPQAIYQTWVRHSA